MCSTITKKLFEKHLIENSLKYAIAYGVGFFCWNMQLWQEYCVYRQKNVLEWTSFQEYHVRSFSDGLQGSYLIRQDVHLSSEVLEERLILNTDKLFAFSLLRCLVPLSVIRYWGWQKIGFNWWIDEVTM